MRGDLQRRVRNQVTESQGTVLTKSNVPQDRYPGGDVIRKESIVETGHRVTPGFRNFLHFRQLLSASGGQIQKRQSVEFLSLLIGLLYNLCVRIRGVFM